jgi:uncharacterized protein (DUF433 family)
MNLSIDNIITINPEVCFGKPTIRGTRYSVQMILELLASGMTNEEILEDFPALNQQDLRACMWFASALVQQKTTQKAIV